MAGYVVPSFLNTVHYREKIILISTCHEKKRVETHSYREDIIIIWLLNFIGQTGRPSTLEKNQHGRKDNAVLHGCKRGHLKRK